MCIRKGAITAIVDKKDLKVIKGMEFVDLIKRGDPNSGAVSDPDKIISLRSK